MFRKLVRQHMKYVDDNNHDDTNNATTTNNNDNHNSHNDTNNDNSNNATNYANTTAPLRGFQFIKDIQLHGILMYEADPFIAFMYNGSHIIKDLLS